MRYLVTGGCGFIGSHIAEALATEGAEVRIYDNLSSGYERNIAGFRDKVQFTRADVRDRSALELAMEGVEGVFHEAALVSVFDSVERPLDNHEINVTGTLNVLLAARARKVRRVVVASSAAVYGNDPALPKREDMLPQPESPYGAAKIAKEHLMAVFAKLYGLQTVSLRYFNVYGPRQDPSSPYSGVLSLFMKAALERKSPVIHGDGEQSRDFTYVEDVVALNLKAARAPGVSGRVYNAGNGGRVTINQAWALVQKLEGVDLAAVHSAPRAGDVRDSQADTTAAVRDLGHAPRYSFEEGMRLTLEWYRRDASSR